MDLIHTDFKKGTVRIRVTDLDDLWYLSHIIEQGDILTAKTTRKIKLGEGENAKMVKKTLTLTIEAETIDLSTTGTTLRINGKVKQETEDIPKDSYHALSLEEGTECTLQKKEWLSYQKQKLNEAAERKAKYLLCLFDREEALFALTQKQGYNIILKLQGDVPKKGKVVDIKKEFYPELVSLLEEYAARYSPDAIILASPAFYKEDLFKRITNPALKQKIALATCSAVHESSLAEVITQPALEKTLKASRSRRENVFVEELLSEISKNGAAVYGRKEVEQAISAGAVRKLLLTDKCIRDSKSSGLYHTIDQGLKQVDLQGGEIHLLSSEDDAGKRLDGLGGIAALLRYKLHWP